MSLRIITNERVLGGVVLAAAVAAVLRTRKEV
jgi:hypothetical protein